MNFPLKTTATNTFEEYRRFSRILLINKRNVIIFALLAVFLTLDSIILRNPLFILFAVIYPLLVFVIHGYRVKKVYNTNKVLKNAVVSYEFYEDCFVDTLEFGTTRLEYDKLYKIIETKTNFYLMIAKNQGFILIKSEFPEGLTEHLRAVKSTCSI